MLLELWSTVILVAIILISIYNIIQGIKTGKFEFYPKWTGIKTSSYLILILHLLIILIASFIIYWFFKNSRL